VHDDWTGPRYLWLAEKAAGGVGNRGEKTMLQLLEEARATTKLAKSARWEDGNKLRDGVLKRAPEEMISVASQYTVSEDQVQEKFAEMVNTSGEYWKPKVRCLKPNIMISILYQRRTAPAQNHQV